MGDFNFADVVTLTGGFRYQIDDVIEPARATTSLHVGGTTNSQGPGLTFGADLGIDSAGEGRLMGRLGFGGPIHMILRADIGVQAGAHLQEGQNGLEVGALVGLVGRVGAISPIGFIGLQGEANLGNLGNGDVQPEFGLSLFWGTSFSLWQP